MSYLFLSILFLLIPSYILFYIGAEVCWRNPTNHLHRLTMVLTFCLGFMLLSQFAMIQFISGDAALLAVRLRFAFAFLTMACAMLFFRHLAGYKRQTLGSWAACLVPLSGVLIALFPSPRFHVGLERHGPVRIDTYTPGFAAILCGLILYTFLSIVIMIVRRQRFPGERAINEHNRIRAITWGTLWTVTAIIATVFINILLIANGVYTFSFLPTTSVILWAFSLRYAMIKYDFLAATGRRYELLFKLSHHGIVLLDGQGRIVEANESFRRLSGVDPALLQGMLFADMLPDSERNCFQEEYHRVVSTLTPLHQEIHLVSMQGVRHAVEVHSDYIEIDGYLYSFLITRDMTKQKDQEQQLAQLAYDDELTGLANRRHFTDRLRQELQDNRELGVMLLDLDQFKWVNDTLGHSAGDELLRQVSRKFRQVTDDGFVARLGGDEFGILIFASVDGILQSAERIIEAMAEPFLLGGKLYKITASLGISMSHRDGYNYELLIQNADMAMYAAKSKGRNQYHVYTAQMRTDADHYMSMVSGLSAALEASELLLQYQPQIDLQTNRVIGVEALIRWESKELGFVPPNVFIPIAESTGLIIPIGKWVLKEAIKQTKQWVDRGFTDLLVSVNLSALQLQEPDFAAAVARMLEENGLPPSNLCLEITESTAISDVESSHQVCVELTEMGIRLAVDDFGMGYSSLSMLNRFPFHFIKIDRSLVTDIVTNRRDLAVIRAVIALARDLEMQVVAEGVETELQHEMLRGLGCHEGQGYLYGRPMSKGDVTAYLEKRGNGAAKGTA